VPIWKRLPKIIFCYRQLRRRFIGDRPHGDRRTIFISLDQLCHDVLMMRQWHAAKILWSEKKTLSISLNSQTLTSFLTSNVFGNLSIRCNIWWLRCRGYNYEVQFPLSPKQSKATFSVHEKIVFVVQIVRLFLSAIKSTMGADVKL
jgi:hypothetical protein